VSDTCTCNGDRWPDGSRVVTVGCRVHHVMSDGAPAADFETSCEGCMEFGDSRDGFAWYDEIDPDIPAEERGEAWRCIECGDYGVANGTLRRKPA